MPPSQERWHVHNNNDGSNMHQQFSSGSRKKPPDSTSEAAAKVWPAGCQDIVLSQSSRDAEAVHQTENNYTFTAATTDEQF